MVIAATLLFVAATLGAIIFQLALALGAPWGRYAMGGRFPRKLPGPMRVASALQALLLTAAIGVVVARAGLGLSVWQGAASSWIWAVVGLCAVSLILNLVTPSQAERRLWAPVAAAMLLASLTVAFAG